MIILSSFASDILIMRRVVITGIGLVTPLGLGPSAFSNLIAKKSGIVALTGAEYKDLPSRVAATVKESIKADYSVIVSVY